MKNVLIISPYFPPSKLPPVHRVRLLLNYIEEYGWRPIILTVDPAYYEEELDWELKESLPENMEVHHTRALPVKWTRKVGLGNICLRAYPYMLSAAKRICREKKIDVVFIQPNPYTWLLGLHLKKRFGIPFIVDYQDPWVARADNPLSPLNKAWWANSVSRILEPLILRKVDHIVGVSQGTYETIRKPYPYLRDEDFTELPFGGEPRDFEHIEKFSAGDSFFNGDCNPIRFSYIGAISDKMHKNLRAFMAAVAKIKEARPELYGRLSLYFCGSTYAHTIRLEDMKATIIARQAGVEDIVTEKAGRIKYFDALRAMRGSDVLLVFGLEGAHYTASKIHACILARRPILGILHEKSLVVETVREMKAGCIITYSDDRPVEECIDSIAAEIERLARENDYNLPPVDGSIFERYGARHMTHALAKVFDKTAGQPVQ